MPNTKSAIKAAKQSLRRNAVNLQTKLKYKKALKNFRKLAEAGGAEAAKALSEAVSMLDKAAKKHVIKKNKASRLKSRMAKALKKITK